jgi:hypothetical protein
VIFNDSPNPAVADVSFPSGIAEWKEVDIATGAVREWSPLGLEPSPMSLSIKPMELAAFRLRATPAGTPPASSAVRSAAVESHAGQDASVVLSDGWTLMLPGRADTPVPISVDSGWEQQGFGSYSGVGYYTCQFDRPPGGSWRLRIPSVRTAVEVRLNGHLVGGRAWIPYEFDLPEGLLQAAGNTLEIAVFSAAGNKYYSGSPFQDGPEPSGLLAPPLLVATTPR